MLKILLSNDDGVQATGIKALQDELSHHFSVTTVAPLEERSTTGHSLSLDKPLRIEKLADAIYGCSGFPGDCVLVALGHLLKDQRPDLVVSGINRGANLGQDLYYSGTVAAAREASFHGVPSLAVSLVLKSGLKEANYQTAAAIVHWLLQSKVHQVIAPLTLLNLNVPDIPLKEIKGIKLTNIGFRKYSEEVNERIDSRGRPYYWIVGLYRGHEHLPDSDCTAIDSGYASLTIHHLVAGVKQETERLEDLIKRINDEYFS